MARFWLTWTSGSILGFAAGFAGMFVLVGVLTGDEGPEAWGIPFEVAFPLVIGLGGLAMAAVQYSILRRRLDGAGRWIPATALGLLVGVGILMALTALGGEAETLAGSVVTGAIHGAVVGAVVGGAQSLALSTVEARRRWVLVNITALTVASAIGDGVGFYTDGGKGILIIFGLWHAAVAAPLYRMISEPSRLGETAHSSATAG